MWMIFKQPSGKLEKKWKIKNRIKKGDNIM